VDIDTRVSIQGTWDPFLSRPITIPVPVVRKGEPIETLSTRALPFLLAAQECLLKRGSNYSKSFAVYGPLLLLGRVRTLWKGNASGGWNGNKRKGKGGKAARRER